MTIPVPKTRSTRIAVAAVIALVHVAATVAASGYTEAATAQVGPTVLVTWLVTMLLGVITVALVPAGRRHWYRWLIVWALIYMAWGDFPVVIMLGGHSWAIYQALTDELARRHSRDVASTRPARTPAR